jgi:hypothetical protein
MVKAYPIDINGDQNGEIQSFSDDQWSRLNKTKGLRWVKVVKEEKKEKVIELIKKDTVAVVSGKGQTKTKKTNEK